MERNILFKGVGLSEGFFRELMNTAPLPMFVMVDGKCMYGNERFTKLRGCADIECDCALDLMFDKTDKSNLSQSLLGLNPGEVARITMNMLGAEGKQTAIDLLIKKLEIEGQVISLGIISEKNEKERIRRLLDRLAFHDTLTDLPNRVLLFDRINQSLSRHNRDGSGFALAILDLDGFKGVNDRHGHATGDIVLKLVADRLDSCLRNVDTVARLGGDEFALVLQGINSEQEAKAVLEKIILEISRPLEIRGVECMVAASIGIAFCPDDGVSIHELLGRADFAMYQAKQNGGSHYRISTGEISKTSARLELEPLIDIIKLGFDIIDEQHEEIASCVKGILRAVGSGESVDGLRRRAEYLLQLTQEHFSTEEEFMLRYATSGRDEHRMEHLDLLHQLDGLLPGHDQHGMTVMSYIFRDWLVPHIQTRDAELVDQLRAAGVTGQ